VHRILTPADAMLLFPMSEPGGDDRGRERFGREFHQMRIGMVHPNSQICRCCHDCIFECNDAYTCGILSYVMPVLFYMIHTWQVKACESYNLSQEAYNTLEGNKRQFCITLDISFQEKKMNVYA